jgi:hypothetical protein
MWLAIRTRVIVPSIWISIRPLRSHRAVCAWQRRTQHSQAAQFLQLGLSPRTKSSVQERVRIQFRFEAFHFTNTPRFCQAGRHIGHGDIRQNHECGYTTQPAARHESGLVEARRSRIEQVCDCGLVTECCCD